MLKALLLPSGDLSNPVFRLESRRLRWGNANYHFLRFSLRAASILVGFIYTCWLLFAISSSYFNLLATIQNVAAITFVISIAADFFIDLISMTFTITAISGEINVKHWDLVRLSLLDRESIIKAKHAIANIRVWRMMAVVWLLRCLTAALFVLMYFIPTQYDGRPLISNVLRSLVTNPFEVIFVFATLITFAAIYLIEPKWRMSAQTALGLAISARMHNTLNAGLAALAVIVVIWTVQIIILALYAWMTVNLLMDVRNPVVAFCFLFLACGGTALTVRVFYSALRQWALDYALRHAFKYD